MPSARMTWSGSSKNVSELDGEASRRTYLATTGNNVYLLVMFRRNKKTETLALFKFILIIVWPRAPSTGAELNPMSLSPQMSLSVSHPFQRVDKQSAVKLLVLDSFWKCLSLSCHPFDLWIETFSPSTVCSSFLKVNHCNIKCMFWYLCVHYLCLWRLLIVRAELLIEPRLCINLEHSLSG